MIFTPNQIEELLSILDYHHTFVIATNLGASVLSEYDRNLLKGFGIDLDKINSTTPLYEKMFLFGRLTAVLGDLNSKQVDYSDFSKFVKRGQYIPLNEREKFELEIAKRKTYTHLKGIREKAKGEFESIIIGEERKSRGEYESAISEETTKGVIDRKAVSSIVSDLGHRFENWQHDWNRIVETEMQNIYQQGVAEVLKEVYGEEVEVYKTPYPLACRHCIRLYLTEGIGSKPIVFKLKNLEANGTNIGRKVPEWKATVGTIHPFCRCPLKYKPKGYIWDEGKQRFVIPEHIERRVIRTSKIKIDVGDKVFEV